MEKLHEATCSTCRHVRKAKFDGEHECHLNPPMMFQEIFGGGFNERTQFTVYHYVRKWPRVDLDGSCGSHVWRKDVADKLEEK